MIPPLCPVVLEEVVTIMVRNYSYPSSSLASNLMVASSFFLFFEFMDKSSALFFWVILRSSPSGLVFKAYCNFEERCLNESVISLIFRLTRLQISLLTIYFGRCGDRSQNKPKRMQVLHHSASWGHDLWRILQVQQPKPASKEADSVFLNSEKGFFFFGVNWVSLRFPMELFADSVITIVESLDSNFPFFECFTSLKCAFVSSFVREVTGFLGYFLLGL